MTERWEYLNLTWTYEAEKIEVPEFLPIHRVQPPEPKWIYKEEFRIRRPGTTESEQLHSGNTGSTPHFSSVLNDLGAEGWELVGFEATASRVGKYLGWSEVGYPVARNWVFKRRVSDPPLGSG